MRDPIRVRAWEYRVATFAAAFAFSVGGLVLASASPALAATGSAPQLTVATAHSTYRSGAAVPLTVTVTNAGSSACALASTPDGSVIVSSATRNGVALTPSYSALAYLDGAGGHLAAHLATVAPNRSINFTIDAGANGGLAVPTPVLGQSDVVATWPTAARGAYRFELAYQVSALAGDKACVGESNTVAVAFRVGDAGSRPWLVIGAIAVVVVLIVIGLLALLLLRRRRARRRRAFGPIAVATTVVGLALATGALAIVRAAPASAGTVFDPGSGSDSSANSAAYGVCLGRIDKFDPGLIPGFNRPGASLTINAGPYGKDTHTSWDPPDGRDITVWWDPNYRDAFADGVIADPCASLYHELSHAEDEADGTLSNGECDDTGINDDEVYASLAENAYRRANGLEPRQTYGSKALPSSMAACTPPTPKKGGWLNGDPHLLTFDGQRYDFQAVGEFTAVGSTAGDLTVQVRQAAFATSKTVAVNSAVAMDVSGTKLGFYLADGQIVVHRAGAVVSISPGSTGLASGATLERTDDPYHGAEYLVTWADGTSASVVRAGVYGLVVTVTPSAARADTLTGLLGNFDGDPKNDVAVRGGKVITPDFASLYPAYADSWRVTSATSLFDYSPGTSTSTFTDRSFPSKPETADGLTDAQRSAARGACAAAGVVDATDLADCELDVAVTGSAEFAISAADLEQSRFPGPAAASGGSPTSPPSDQTTTTTTTATVTAPNTVAHVTFTATQGQRVHVQVLATTLPNQCGALALHGPDDNVLVNGCTAVGDAIDGYLLPVSGEYNIYVDPTAGAVGSITVLVRLSQDLVVPATIDGPPVVATIAAPGDQAQVTFTATAGEKLFVKATDVSLPDQCGALQLDGPGGGALLAGCITAKTGYLDGIVLTSAGSYAVIVNPSGESTGSVTLSLISDHDQQLQATVGGPAVAATVAQPGAVSNVTFPGTAGEKIEVLGSASTLPQACDIRVVSPAQAELTSLCDRGGTGSLGTVTLPLTGTYTLVLDPGEEDVGQIDLTVTVAH